MNDIATSSKRAHVENATRQLGEAETLLRRFSSPLFVYDLDRAQAQLRRLREAFAGLPLQIRYAVKANPCHTLLTSLRTPRGDEAGVDGVDVASTGELRLALAAGFLGDAISFAGPGKSDDELHDAIRARAHLSVESLGELERLVKLTRDAKEKGEIPSESPLDVRLRVNPQERIHAYGLTTAGGPSPFGIDEEQLPEASAFLRRHHALLRFEGVHVHPGSQCFSAAAMARSFDTTLAIARRLEREEALAAKTINLGGGLGVATWAGGKALDLGDLGHRLRDLWRTHTTRSPKARAGSTTLEIEPGRFLAGPMGRYLCRVTDVKVSRGRTFAVVDGGMHHLLATTGIYGPTPPRSPRVRNLTGESAQRPKAPCTIVGRLCTSHDRLAETIDLETPHVGDILAFDDVGAYGLSASPVRFLGHPTPAEVVLLAGVATLARAPAETLLMPLPQG